MSIILQIPSPIEQLKSSFLEKYGVELWVKRDDLIHPEISGNKWRKLELNVANANKKQIPILTFGGAYSNHIAATAVACNNANISSIGIIRGNELPILNHTLSEAKQNGMELQFVSREEYRKKGEPAYLKTLEEKYGKFHLVPEGGANKEGVLGSRNIRKEIQQDFDILCCTTGTGTTAAGILSALQQDEKLEVYPALKGGEYLENEILELLSLVNSAPEFKAQNQMLMVNNYHFGGFAKLKPKAELIDFVNWFYDEFKIPLDLIYNGKMMFGIFDRIKKEIYASGTKLMVIHCGGLQGNISMAERFGVDLDY